MPSSNFQILSLVLANLFSLNLAQTIDPNSVDIGTRETWCSAQQAACPLICLQLPNANGPPEANNCTATDLTYQCVCSNGMQPNASQYSQTIPYFECTEFNTQCVANCGDDSACATACRTNNPCGAQNPIRINATTTSTTMSATATSSVAGSQVYTGFGGVTATSTSSTGKSGANGVAVSLGQSYGLAVVVTGFLGGFALLL